MRRTRLVMPVFLIKVFYEIYSLQLVAKGVQGTPCINLECVTEGPAYSITPNSPTTHHQPPRLIAWVPNPWTPTWTSAPFFRCRRPLPFSYNEPRSVYPSSTGEDKSSLLHSQDAPAIYLYPATYRPTILVMVNYYLIYLSIHLSGGRLSALKTGPGPQSPQCRGSAVGITTTCPWRTSSRARTPSQRSLLGKDAYR